MGVGGGEFVFVGGRGRGGVGGGGGGGGGGGRSLQSHVCPQWPRHHTCHTEHQSVCRVLATDFTSVHT
jgi:hypothetical protein